MIGAIIGDIVGSWMNRSRTTCARISSCGSIDEYMVLYVVYFLKDKQGDKGKCHTKLKP